MNFELNYIIVTNTFNRPVELVERSLRASLCQKIAPRHVILLDQNNPSIKLPDDIESHPLFKKQFVHFNSVSAARNALDIPYDVEWIFFCDDDGFPHKNYSEILLKKIIENPGIDILAGSILRDDTLTNYTLRQKKIGSMKYFRHSKKLMGSNFVVKTKVFQELGRFDENFGVGSYWGSGEETDFCWHAYFSKKKMEFFPELIVYHIPPFQESISRGFKKSFNYGRGKGALVWKWLVKKRRRKVFYELFEMVVIPFFQMLRGIITLKLELIPNNIAALTGRIYGLIKAALVKK